MEFYVSKVNRKYYMHSFEIFTLSVIFAAAEKTVAEFHEEHEFFCLYEQIRQKVNVE